MFSKKYHLWTPFLTKCSECDIWRSGKERRAAGCTKTNTISKIKDVGILNNKASAKRKEDIVKMDWPNTKNYIIDVNTIQCKELNNKILGKLKFKTKKWKECGWIYSAKRGEGESEGEGTNNYEQLLEITQTLSKLKGAFATYYDMEAHCRRRLIARRRSSRGHEETKGDVKRRGRPSKRQHFVT